MTQRVVNYTYGTGNPVLPDGSIDVRDGIDNLQSMDVFMNAPEDTYNQRDGGVAKTVHGIINEFNKQLNQRLNQQETEFETQILEQQSEFNQHISGMAFTRVGTFESGATLDDVREVLLWDVANGGDGHEYGWTGPFTKEVLPNSAPSSTGGIGPGAWVDRTDVALRSELAATGGAGIIGGIAQPVTSPEFAGGADPTGATPSDAAFAAAAAYVGNVYIPAGTYSISAVYRGNFICDEEAEFIGGGKVMYKNRAMFPAPGVPSVVHRFNRVAVGDTAFDFGGARNDKNLSWLGQKVPAPNGTLQPGLGWFEKNARLSGFTSHGTIGIAGATHSAGSPNSAANIAIAGAAVQDNHDARSTVWALYLDAKNDGRSVGGVFGAEIAICNHGPYADAYAPTNAKTTALLLQSGADPVINGATEDTTSAIGIANAGSKFGVGINYGGGSLRIFNNPGPLGNYMKAAALRGNMTYVWEGTAGEVFGYINSINNDATQPSGIMMRANRVDILGSDRAISESIGHVGDKNYFQFESAATASNVLIRALSADASKAGISLIPSNGGEIQVSGHLRGFSPNTTLCGTSTTPWSGGFTQSAFTVTSDENHKTSPEHLTDTMLDAAAEVDWCMFQYLDRVEEKGADGARWHFGAIAQRFVEAFANHGLDAHRFGFICYDEWESAEAVVSKETGEIITPAVEAGSRYGIRYEQAIILKQKQIERDHNRRIEALLSRIEALEAK